MYKMAFANTLRMGQNFLTNFDKIKNNPLGSLRLDLKDLLGVIH